MNEQMKEIEIDELMREIGRYLASVELFRGEGCEPGWRTEFAPDGGRGIQSRRREGFRI